MTQELVMAEESNFRPVIHNVPLVLRYALLASFYEGKELEL